MKLSQVSGLIGVELEAHVCGNSLYTHAVYAVKEQSKVEIMPRNSKVQSCLIRAKVEILGWPKFDLRCLCDKGSGGTLVPSKNGREIYKRLNMTENEVQTESKATLQGINSSNQGKVM